MCNTFIRIRKNRAEQLLEDRDDRLPGGSGRHKWHSRSNGDLLSSVRNIVSATVEERKESIVLKQTGNRVICFHLRDIQRLVLSFIQIEQCFYDIFGKQKIKFLASKKMGHNIYRKNSDTMLFHVKLCDDVEFGAVFCILFSDYYHKTFQIHFINNII